MLLGCCGQQPKRLRAGGNRARHYPRPRLTQLAPLVCRQRHNDLARHWRLERGHGAQHSTHRGSAGGGIKVGASLVDNLGGQRKEAPPKKKLPPGDTYAPARVRGSQNTDDTRRKFASVAGSPRISSGGVKPQVDKSMQQPRIPCSAG